jgi:hypothetical protein
MGISKGEKKMISAIVIGLGLIAAAVGYFASEIYLAKKVSTPRTSLNHRNN